MADRLIIFEDDTFAEFYPLTLNRPVFFLRCGAFRLWEKIARKFTGYDLSFSCRDELTGLVSGRTSHTVNHITYAPGDRLVFVNGRLHLGEKLARELMTATTNTIFVERGCTAAVVIVENLQSAPAADIRFTGDGAAEALGVKADIAEGEFEWFGHLWDLVNLNANEIAADYVAAYAAADMARMIDEARIDSSARILAADNLYVAPDAEIAAGCVIDNRHGPVIIEAGAKIGPLSFIEGPCYIGPGTQIFRGNIREGCSFGPTCRVGGEVEESIFQGYTNKYHDGFMGHAYLGSWVNLGAMTTNSDLKNNYKNITVSVNGRAVDSRSMKVGSFIGDHTKTGIGTLINTGVSIGFSSNIYGGTLVTSSEVPSFSWGDETGYDLYRLDKAIEVATKAMARRDIPFTEDDRAIFTMIFEQTTAARG